MKKALKIILVYFFFLILGFALGTLLYYFFISVLNSVVGRQSPAFISSDFLKIVFYVLFCLFVLICPAVIYYLVRHSLGAFQLMAVVFVSLLTWGLFLPLSLNFLQKYNADSEFSFSDQKLTGGYFRRNKDVIFYFASDLQNVPFPTDTTTGVLIDTSPSGNASVKEFSDYPEFELYQAASPYKDILIKQNFAGSVERLPHIIDFHILLEKALAAWQKGISFWLGFASLGLLLCSFYSIAHLFEWRLVNSAFLICAVLGALALNTQYYMPFFEKIRNSGISDYVVFDIFSRFVDEPLLVLLNVAFSLIFITAGIILSVVQKKKRAKV